MGEKRQKNVIKVFPHEGRMSEELMTKKMKRGYRQALLQVVGWNEKGV